MYGLALVKNSDVILRFSRKCDGQTDRPTERPTDRLTERCKHGFGCAVTLIETDLKATSGFTDLQPNKHSEIS